MQRRRSGSETGGQAVVGGLKMGRGGGKLLVKIGISIIPFYLLILLFYEYFFVPMLKMFAKKKWGAKTILKVGRGGKVMYPLAMAPTMPLLLCTGSMSLSKHVTHYG